MQLYCKFTTILIPQTIYANKEKVLFLKTWLLYLHLSVSSLSIDTFLYGSTARLRSYLINTIHSAKEMKLYYWKHSLFGFVLKGWGAFCRIIDSIWLGAPCEHSLLYSLTTGDTEFNGFVAGFGCRRPGAELANGTSVWLAWARGKCLTALQQIVLSTYQQTL